MSDGGINLFNQHVVASKSPFDVNRLQDRFRRQQSNWSTPEAYLCLLLASSMADGNFDAGEGATIQLLARRSRALATISPSDFGKLNDVVNQRMAQNPHAVQEACQTLPEDMALSVFAHCVDVILSDGQLIKSEADFLNKLVEWMGIQQEHATRIMEVMLLKAQY